MSTMCRASVIVSHLHRASSAIHKLIFVILQYILYKNRDSGEDNSKLDRYVLFQRNTGSIEYTVTLPVAGEYKIDIFGKDGRKHNSIDLICSYLLTCTLGATDEEPLPDNPEIGWGPHGGYLTGIINCGLFVIDDVIKVLLASYSK